MIAPAGDVKSSWKRTGHDTLDMFKAPAKRAKLSPTAHPTTSNTSDASDVSLFSPDGNVMNKTVPLRHAVIESRVPSRVEQSPSDSDKSDTTTSHAHVVRGDHRRLAPHERYDERLDRVQDTKGDKNSKHPPTLENVNLAWTAMCRDSNQRSSSRRISWGEKLWTFHAYAANIDDVPDSNLRRENELLKIHCDNYQNEIEELRERVLEGLRSKISLQQQKKNLEEELENYKLQIISMQERVMHMEQSSQHSINQKK